MIDLIDIRIMGVPERMENIKKTQKILGIPDANVFLDTEHKGVKFNAKRAWLKPTRKSHVLLLQDDVELCDDFMKYLNITVDLHPNDVISLFPYQFRTAKELRRYPPTPYVEVTIVSGQGIVMPKKYIKPCNDWWELHPEIIGDDTEVQEWALENHIRILTTIPTLLQHIGDVSVFNNDRKIGKTVAYLKDPSGSDWENGFVTNWSNLKRVR